MVMPLQILPSIDLRNGRVVRLQQGDYARQLNYAVDPLETARSFVAAGAAWMHVVDLDGAQAGAVQQTKMIQRLIAEVPGLHVQVGGGVRSDDDVQALLDAGAARVVVGTKALEDWHWFERLTPKFAGKIVLALDAKDGVVATRAWTASSGKRAIDIARWVSGWPLAGILYTDVARDGMLGGPNVENTQALVHAGDVPVIASGGVGTLDHVRELIDTGIWGVVIGRSLYEGKISLSDAISLVGDRP